MVEVPIVCQLPGFCGPAVVLMGLGKLGIDVDQISLAKLIGADPELGCEAPQIVKALRKLGLDCFFHDNCTLEELRQYSKNHPTFVDFYDPEISSGHYVNIIDVSDSKVYFSDPYSGKERELEHSEFLANWFDTEGPEEDSKFPYYYGRVIVFDTKPVRKLKNNGVLEGLVVKPSVYFGEAVPISKNFPFYGKFSDPEVLNCYFDYNFVMNLKKDTRTNLWLPKEIVDSR